MTSSQIGRNSERSIAARLARGGTWNVVATASAQGSVFVTGVVIANLLGAESFGAYSLLNTTLTTLANLAQFGAGLAALKFIAELRNVDPAAAASAVRESLLQAGRGALVIACLLLAAAGPISAQALAAPALRWPLVVLALAVLLIARATVHQSALSALEAFRRLASASALHGLAFLACCSVGAYLGGVLGSAIGMTCAAAVRYLLLSRATDQEFARQQLPSPRGPRASTELRSRITSFMLPAAVAGMSTLPALWIISALLARSSGGLTQVAWFNVALSLRSMVCLLPGLFTSVSSVLVNDALGARDAARFRRVLLLNAYATAAGAVALAACVYFARSYILQAYGSEFSGAQAAIGAAMVLAILETVTGALYVAVVAHAQMWRLLLWIVLPRDVLTVVLAWLLFEQYGAVGVLAGMASAWTLSAAVIALWVASLVRRMQPAVVSQGS